jgi:DNA-binding FadR family transcriptional regulator
MNDNLLFSPYESRRAFQEIAEEIKHAILAKRLKAGDRLPSERSLAQQFQVGRLTIREALRTLETNGLIKIKYGREGGAFVGVPDPMRLPSMVIDNLLMEGLTSDQMTEARIGLERTIVKYAIWHANSEDLSRIEQNIEESKEILEPERGEEILSKMIEFHILLGEASHNLPFTMFTRTLMEWARRKLAYWIPTAEEQLYSYKSHKKIFKSIRDKDVDLAQRRIEDHVVRMTALITKTH